MDLGVNIDHIATLRNARLSPTARDARNPVYPDPVRAAQISQQAGAHSIVMHLREDRRHIRDLDLFAVQRAIRIRLNMEMSIAPEIVRIASKLRPDQVTLVPEKRKEMTTEGGLDLITNEGRIRRAVGQLRARGIDVSLFIDPDLKQVAMAKKMGAQAVEFHTGDFARAYYRGRPGRELKKLSNAVLLANAMKILAHAGHGLDYDNVASLRKVQGLSELNIGYAIVTRSFWVGLDTAVRQMKRLLS